MPLLLLRPNNNAKHRTRISKFSRDDDFQPLKNKEGTTSTALNCCELLYIFPLCARSPPAQYTHPADDHAHAPSRYISRLVDVRAPIHAVETFDRIPGVEWSGGTSRARERARSSVSEKESRALFRVIIFTHLKDRRGTTTPREHAQHTPCLSFSAAASSLRCSDC